MHSILQGGAKERDEWTMARRDNKGRILRTGESQRNDGRYDYRYTDSVTGKRKTVYSADLAKLREKEKKIQRSRRCMRKCLNRIMREILLKLYTA